jgi:hypothetical protein
MQKILYWLGRLYVKSPFPMYVSVLLTIAVVVLLLYWLFF